MKVTKKTLMIIGVLVVASFLFFDFDKLLLILEPNVLDYRHPLDIQIVNQEGDTYFQEGDLIKLDLTFVNEEFAEFWRDNAAVDRQFLDRFPSGWIIFVDNKIYDRELGAYTKSDCSQCPFTNCRVCDCQACRCYDFLYSDEWLAQQGLPVTKMGDAEKRSLTGCHVVEARVGMRGRSDLQCETAGGSEFNVRKTRICFDGSKPTELPVVSGGGCDVFN